MEIDRLRIAKRGSLLSLGWVLHEKMWYVTLPRTKAQEVGNERLVGKLRFMHDIETQRLVY